MFAGLGDNDIPLYSPDEGTGGPAAWLVSETWMTPRDRFRGVIHKDDDYFRKTTEAWRALGLEVERDWKELTGPTPRPHGYVSSDAAEATAARAWACFE
jgi:hypothetical protein